MKQGCTVHVGGGGEKKEIEFKVTSAAAHNPKP